MVLSDQWLTIAVALFLPALALIEERADLPPLRIVALALSGIVLTRLLLNWYILDYALGRWPVVNMLLLTYGVPAICFFAAAHLFRRRADDVVVAVLEAGGAAFATVLAALEVRHLAHHGDLTQLGTRFLEAALHVCSLGILSLVTMRLATRLKRPVLDWTWRIQGALALCGGIFLILANPAFSAEAVDGPAILNPLLIAYLLPAMLAATAQRRHVIWPYPGLMRLLGAYMLTAMFVWITLEIRHNFHPGRMALIFTPVDDVELWSWSAAWLAYGIALMVVGIRLHVRAVRLAALAVVGITTAKVFLIDTAGLTGLLRVLSFLGLGLTLIGLGAVFRRFVAKADQTQAPPT